MALQRDLGSQFTVAEPAGSPWRPVDGARPRQPVEEPKKKRKAKAGK